MKQTFTYLVAAVLGFLSPSLSSWAQNFNGVFKEITSQADFTEGYYVIVKPESSGSDMALCGLKKSKAENSKKFVGEKNEITINANGEISSPQDIFVWNIKKDGEFFTIQHKTSRKYLSAPKNDNALHFEENVSNNTKFSVNQYAKHYNGKREIAYTFYQNNQKRWLVHSHLIDDNTFVFTSKGSKGNKLNTAAPRFFKLVGLPFTMSAVQYSTYYGAKTVKLPAGLTANVGEIDAQKHMLKLTSIGNVVPANTAVIITGAAGEYTLDMTTETGSAPARNDLKGSMIDIPAATVSSASFAYYAMAHNPQTNKVCFGLVKGINIPAGKAYLEIPKTSGAAPELLGDFLISSVQHVQRDSESAMIYDLNGRKVTQPVSGQLYVRNGKKFIYLR